MEIRNQALRQLKNRREGFSLEQAFYTDPNYYKLDLEMIWYRDWLFVGHDCELPKNGSYFTLQCAAATVRSALFITPAAIGAAGSAPRKAVRPYAWSVPIINGLTNWTARS
jgi:hypothetical protein